MFSWQKKKSQSEAVPDRWPKFSAGNKAIARWTHKDGRQRVYLLVRADGMFSRWGEHYSDEEFEHCWIPDDRGGSFFDSKETAKKEILSAYPWAQAAREEQAND